MPPHAGTSHLMKHLFSIGFRPFFLSAGLMGAIWMALWLFFFFGVFRHEGRFDAVSWHAHEMIFGYGGAVLAGFLLTAVRNWTGRSTPSGAGLAILFAFWVLTRLTMLFSDLAIFALVFEVAFFAGIGAAILRPIIAARNWRNVAFPMLLFAMGAAATLTQLAAMRLLPAAWLHRGLHVGLDAVLIAILLVGGRIIPFFTARGLGVEVRAQGIWDLVSVLLVSMAMVIVLFSSELPRASGVVPILAAATVMARMYGWRSFASRRVPLLWVLHVGWGLLAIGLVSQGTQKIWGWPSTSASTHTLTVGALGLLTYGMMARVSLGHSGRPLKPSAIVVAGFVIFVLAFAVRVGLPLIAPVHYSYWVVTAGVLWSLAFVLFTFVYAPILVRPRADGKAD